MKTHKMYEFRDMLLIFIGDTSYMVRELHPDFLLYVLVSYTTENSSDRYRLRLGNTLRRVKPSSNPYHNKSTWMPLIKPRPHCAEWCRATGSIDTVEQVWTRRPALMSHAGPNRTQHESSRYGSKEVDATTVVCWSVLFHFSLCAYSFILFKIDLCLRLWWSGVTNKLFFFSFKCMWM